MDITTKPVTDIVNPFAEKNPFAVTAPGAPSAAAATATPATAEGYDASTATTKQADPTLRTVQDNELVQRQLEQIIGDDSPLIQRARAKAQERAAARGLINSSMAIGASDAAAYDVALPIAQADANTFGTTARDNQAVQNSMSQFNAGESNATSRTNAGLINQAAAFTAGASNDASRTNADLATRTNLANADATNRMALQTNDQQFRASLANADPQVRAALATLDNEFAMQRQSSQASSEVWRQYQSSATAIMTSDLPAESKQQMIDQLLQQTRQAMVATGAMDRAGIDAILTMPDLPASAPASTATAATPAATAAPAAAGTVAPAPDAAGNDPWAWQGVNYANQAG